MDLGLGIALERVGALRLELLAGFINQPEILRVIWASNTGVIRSSCAARRPNTRSRALTSIEVRLAIRNLYGVRREPEAICHQSANVEEVTQSGCKAVGLIPGSNRWARGT